MFGIAGPIGIDVDLITRVLSDTLKSVGYRSALIKITDEIMSIESSVTPPEQPSFYNEMKFKMSHASAICREKKDPKFLMHLAVAGIRRERAKLALDQHNLATPDDEIGSVDYDSDEGDINVFMSLLGDRVIAPRSAFMIRQIKRPDEVHFMRSLYGDQFILISAYGSAAERQKVLEERIRTTSRTTMPETRVSFLASKLINADMDEERDEFGQRLRDAFHLADVVVEGIDKTKMGADLTRFIEALFGSNEIGPSRIEHGMNAAAAASLRSLDLSRQVGAVIFSESGEVISQGCNEVPKAGGGTYWDQEVPDYRDIKLGKDSNDILKMDVLKDLIEKMKRNNILAPSVVKIGSPLQIAEFLVGRGPSTESNERMRGALKASKILDLTEYGRVVHAEMGAICDAARSGTSVKGSTLYCTTFPCHNCTKHIISSGVRKVFFLEPYPKSKAKELHSHEIIIEGEDEQKVSFIAFKGITPKRFPQIFKKAKRKRDGVAVKWTYGGPAPMIDVSTPAYLQIEEIFAHEDSLEDQPKI